MNEVPNCRWCRWCKKTTVIDLDICEGSRLRVKEIGLWQPSDDKPGQGTISAYQSLCRHPLKPRKVLNTMVASNGCEGYRPSGLTRFLRSVSNLRPAVYQKGPWFEALPFESLTQKELSGHFQAREAYLKAIALKKALADGKSKCYDSTNNYLTGRVEHEPQASDPESGG